ncbi:hypothetical protein HK414_17840 [Ramlibacter terrae]|uniref:DUF1311 domain-containing protein n=1 Tax=Ramlibacter terrae TaxID=2732511 RepID=A0ABX6P425_9BURK|nr:hypothetical protein HK414_17840 [Ramlibacter terrae]
MHHRIAWLAALLCCAAGAGGLNGNKAPMSKEAYRAQQQRIEAEYDATQARCKPLDRTARNICNEKARGARDIAAAELQMQMKPTADNDEKVRMAKAEAVYAVSLETCKAMEGNAREVCRKDAKAVFAGARAEAKLQKEVVAQTLKSERVVRDSSAVAERQAEAQFAAARERCDMLPPEGKENCRPTRVGASTGSDAPYSSQRVKPATGSRGVWKPLTGCASSA